MGFLDNYDFFSAPQKIFHWSGSNAKLHPPTDYLIEKIDRSFLQNDYQNKEFLLDELRMAYGDIELYFKYGIAYVAIQDNTVIARADMLFSDNGYGIISVNTEGAHRRKGISTYLAMKTIEDTYKLGLIPIWDCTEDNLASEMIAKRCGFQMIRGDVISWFMMDKLR